MSAYRANRVADDLTSFADAAHSFNSGTSDSRRTQIPLRDRREPAGNCSEAEAPEERRPDRLVVRIIENIHEERVEWLWPGYVPSGCVSIIEGDPGCGKTSAVFSIAAALTRGGRMPDGSQVPSERSPNVIVCSAEDDPSRTIRPRLRALEADLSRVMIIDGVGGDDSEDEPARPLTLPTDVTKLRALIEERDVGLVIIDPLEAFLAAGLNPNSNVDVRSALTPLAKLAQETGAAVVLIRHLNKKSGEPLLYRGSGSIGLTGAARAVFMAAEDPRQQGAFLFGALKANLSKKPRTMRYRIESVGATSRVAWEGATEQDLEKLLATQGGGGAKLAKAMEIIVEKLSRGPAASQEVYDAVKQSGISQATAKAAVKKLGIQTSKDGLRGPWVMSLPDGEAESAKEVNE